MQVETVAPALGFKFRGAVEFLDPAKAEVCYGHDAVRQVQNAADVCCIENADPADAEALGACRRPQVLNGADGAVEAGVAVMGAAQYGRSAALAVASDAKVDGCGTSVVNAARSTLQRWARCGISPHSRFSGPSASTKRAEIR